MEYKHKRIAVVGVSADPQKYGHRVFRDLLASEYQVFAVNPKQGSVLDQKVYASLKDLPQPPELVITVVPPGVTETIVDACHALGVNHIWMQPGSESPIAVKKAKAYGMKVTEACFMTMNGLW